MYTLPFFVCALDQRFPTTRRVLLPGLEEVPAGPIIGSIENKGNFGCCCSACIMVHCCHTCFCHTQVTACTTVVKDAFGQFLNGSLRRTAVAIVGAVLHPRTVCTMEAFIVSINWPFGRHRMVTMLGTPVLEY